MKAPSPTPLVSICIPAYKAETYILETLQSVRAQSYPHWELLIVEDGSTDGTPAIVEDFSRTITQPLVWLRHEKNKGLPASRNTAIEAATGEWIALLDSDDLWTPKHLENLVQLALQTGADLAHSGVILFDSDTRATLEIREPSALAIDGLPASIFDGTYPIQPSSVLIKTSLLRSIGGFDISFKSVEDRECWIRLFKAGARACFHPERSCLYRQHASAMTKNPEPMAVGEAMCYDKHADWIIIPKRRRVALASEAWVSAGRLVLRSKPKVAQLYFSEALARKPLAPRTAAYWVLAKLLTFFKRT